MTNDPSDKPRAGAIALPSVAALVGGGAAAIDAPLAETWIAQTGAMVDGASAGPVERFTVSRGIAVVPVRGILTPNSEALERWLGWSTYRGIEETCEALAADDDVAAAVMVFDSPGGMVLGLQAASMAVAALASVKPLHGLVDPLAASAAYWLASQCSDIAATPGSLVGSIGVMSGGSSPMQPGGAGWQDFVIRSSHATGKNADLSDDAARAIAQGEIDLMEEVFHRAVAAGRGIPVADLPERLSADGDPTHGGITYGPEDAIRRGLVDAEMSRAAFMAAVVDLYATKPAPARARTGARGAMARARAAQAIAAT